MAKNYTDELAGWARQWAVNQAVNQAGNPAAKQSVKQPRQDAAAVAFVAARADVVAAMAAGYALTTIWKHMRETGKVTCAYETFRKHAHRFISNPSAEPAVVAQHGATVDAAKRPVSARKGEVPKIGRFTFNPSPRQEDVL